MSYLKGLIAETQTPDADIDYYHTTSKELFNRGEEILAKIETSYDQVQKEKDALVNAHKEYMADAVPQSQHTYSSIKHFRYSALPYGHKVIDSSIDVSQPGVGDKLEHYANELASNLEQLTGKLIETKKGMQKDILLTQKCQEKSETFIKQERLIMDKTQTLNEQEAKVKGNLQLINGKFKEQIEQKERQEISDLIQDKILDETIAVNEEYLKIMKRAQDNLGEFTSKFDELQRIKHFEHAAQLRVFCELLEKVFKRGIDLTKEEVQVLDRLKRSLYSGINDLPSAFAQHQKVTAGIKSEKTLQQQFFILKQSLIFDLFVPSNTLSSYLFGITKQFYLSHLIHRFAPDYLSSHAKSPASASAQEYMYLEHLENLVAQGRLGEAVREIETRGAAVLQEKHRREVDEWAMEVRKREYVGVQVEAMRRQADVAVEQGVQELRRQKIL